MPTNATFNGPLTSSCGKPSGNFTVSLDNPINADASFTVSSNIDSDIIKNTSFTIPAGSKSGTFTVTAKECGDRTITISTTSLEVVLSPTSRSYTVKCYCPNDSGTSNQQWIYTVKQVECPPSMLISFVGEFSNNDALRVIYCGRTPTITLTE